MDIAQRQRYRRVVELIYPIRDISCDLALSVYDAFPRPQVSTQKTILILEMILFSFEVVAVVMSDRCGHPEDSTSNDNVWHRQILT